VKISLRRGCTRKVKEEAQTAIQNLPKIGFKQRNDAKGLQPFHIVNVLMSRTQGVVRGTKMKKESGSE
jgi:hypothetical protein